MAETLEQALSRVWETNWQHKRSGATMKAQAEAAIRGVSWPAEHPTASDIGHTRIRAATSNWYKQGLAPATIQKRLSCLATLGVNVAGCKVHVPKQLKWHLSESQRVEALKWLREQEAGLGFHALADFIEWTTRTGLRLEESLGLRWGDLHQDLTTGAAFGISVPGSKTTNAQATLPISTEVAKLLRKRFFIEGKPSLNNRVFPFEYTSLLKVWDEVRKQFGWQDDPTATLKALRRSAARYLHVDCGMPLHMVQQYLRHSNMATTLEYLRLTGGYGTEEMRRYLK